MLSKGVEEGILWLHQYFGVCVCVCVCACVRVCVCGVTSGHTTQLS